jgi:hypothetical protein
MYIIRYTCTQAPYFTYLKHSAATVTLSLRQARQDAQTKHFPIFTYLHPTLQQQMHVLLLLLVLVLVLVLVIDTQTH